MSDKTKDVARSEAVLRAVAEQEGVDPQALPSLYDAIDPDSLDTIYTHSEEVTVKFHYADYLVSVTSDDVTLERSD